MRPNFALNFTDTAVELLHRTARGWLRIGEAALDAPDLDARMKSLRAIALGLAPAGFVTKLVIPNALILYTELALSGDDDTERRARMGAVLAKKTPYAADELAFDWAGAGPVVQVAAVARTTLQEAEEFAESHHLNPVGFVATPDAADFAGEPWFGATHGAAALLPEGETAEPDPTPITLVDDGAPARETRSPAARTAPEHAAPDADEAEAPPPADTRPSDEASEKTDSAPSADGVTGGGTENRTLPDDDDAAARGDAHSPERPATAHAASSDERHEISPENTTDTPDEASPRVPAAHLPAAPGAPATKDAVTEESAPSAAEPQVTERDTAHAGPKTVKDQEKSPDRADMDDLFADERAGADEEASPPTGTTRNAAPAHEAADATSAASEKENTAADTAKADLPSPVPPPATTRAEQQPDARASSPEPAPDPQPAQAPTSFEEDAPDDDDAVAEAPFVRVESADDVMDEEAAFDADAAPPPDADSDPVQSGRSPRRASAADDLPPAPAPAVMALRARRGDQARKTRPNAPDHEQETAAPNTHAVHPRDNTTRPATRPSDGGRVAKDVSPARHGDPDMAAASAPPTTRQGTRESRPASESARNAAQGKDEEQRSKQQAATARDLSSSAPMTSPTRAEPIRPDPARIPLAPPPLAHDASATAHPSRLTTDATGKAAPFGEASKKHGKPAGPLPGPVEAAETLRRRGFTPPPAGRRAPRHLGLLLTAILLICLVLVAAWSSLYLASADDEDASPALTAGEAGDTALPDAEAATGATDAARDDTPAQDQAAEAATGEAPARDDAEAASTDPAASRDAATASPRVADDIGMGNSPPERPGAGTASADDATPAMTAGGAPVTAAASPRPVARVASTHDRIAPPPPAGVSYTIDADGLITPTDEGVPSPGGYMLFAGKPALVPPERSAAAVEAAAQAATDDEATEAALQSALKALEEDTGESDAPAAGETDDDARAASPDGAEAETPATGPNAAPDPALAGFAPQPRPDARSEADPEASTADADDAESASPSEATEVAALSATALAASRRPMTRPDDLAATLPVAPDTASHDAPVDAALEQVAAASSLARAMIATEGAARTSEAPANPALVAVSRRPATRPQDARPIATAAAAPAPAATAPVPASAPAAAAPSIPTKASVAKAATSPRAIKLNQVNLIGVFGTSANRRALIRQKNGRYSQVKVGDRLDGGQVQAITQTEVRYQKGRKLITLAMPQG